MTAARTCLSHHMHVILVHSYAYYRLFHHMYVWFWYIHIHIIACVSSHECVIPMYSQSRNRLCFITCICDSDAFTFKSSPVLHRSYTVLCFYLCDLWEDSSTHGDIPVLWKWLFIKQAILTMITVHVLIVISLQKSQIKQFLRMFVKPKYQQLVALLACVSISVQPVVWSIHSLLVILFPYAPGSFHIVTLLPCGCWGCGLGGVNALPQFRHSRVWFEAGIVTENRFAWILTMTWPSHSSRSNVLENHKQTTTEADWCVVLKDVQLILFYYHWTAGVNWCIVVKDVQLTNLLPWMAGARPE